MTIRKSERSDLSRILEIYDIARGFMRANGNPTQWINYPTYDVIQSDICDGLSYVCEDKNGICAVFVLFFGDDPTYRVITGGKWLDDNPYAAIHRVASDGTVKGITRHIFDYCKTRADNLKCDTHRDNIPMQRALEKNGFVRCGVIFTHDGTERLAYQYKNNVKI